MSEAGGAGVFSQRSGTVAVKIMDATFLFPRHKYEVNKQGDDLVAMPGDTTPYTTHAIVERFSRNMAVWRRLCSTQALGRSSSLTD